MKRKPVQSAVLCTALMFGVCAHAQPSFVHAAGRSDVPALVELVRPLRMETAAEESAAVQQETPLRVRDGADLFTEEEEALLDEQASRISSDYGTDIWICTSNTEGTSDNYARDMLESTGEKDFPDGYIAYGVNMADRSYWVDVYGDMEREIFTQSRTDDLAELAADQLKEGEYYQSAKKVLDSAEKRLAVKTSSIGWLKKVAVYSDIALGILAISAAVATGVAFILTFWKKGKHKDKVLATQADDYGGPLKMDGRHEELVRVYQTRVKIESNSDSGSSFGGGGGGGGGGSAGHTGSGGHF